MADATEPKKPDHREVVFRLVSFDRKCCKSTAPGAVKYHNKSVNSVKFV